MSTIRMARNVALCAFASVFAAEGKHITAVATPVCADVGQGFEAMRDTVIDLLFVPITSVRLGYTFRDDLLITFLVTRVSTIFALISEGIQEEIVAESAEHKLVKLSLYEFMSVHLVDLAFTFANGALTTETCPGRPSPGAECRPPVARLETPCSRDFPPGPNAPNP